MQNAIRDKPRADVSPPIAAVLSGPAASYIAPMGNPNTNIIPWPRAYTSLSAGDVLFCVDPSTPYLPRRGSNVGHEVTGPDARQLPINTEIKHHQPGAIPYADKFVFL